MPTEVEVKDSILQSTKKLLGIDAAYEVYDLDVTQHINSAMATLSDIGVGPEGGFVLENENQTWDEYLDDDSRSNRVKTYIYLFVRRAFDPPGTGFLSTSIDNQIKELETRLSYQREESVTVDEEVEDG